MRNPKFPLHFAVLASTVDDIAKWELDERELSRQDVSEESSAGGLERAKPVFGRRALLGRGVETAQGQILPQKWLTTNPYYSPKGHAVLNNLIRWKSFFIKHVRGAIFYKEQNIKFLFFKTHFSYSNQNLSI